MKLVNGSPSQAKQDAFVLNMLNWKRDGFYLEIGAAYPHELSNTYILEKEYGWKGVSLEINQGMCYDFNQQRSNQCYCLDATTTDYSELLGSVNAPKRIDYLQLDIEPAKNTLQALKQMPLDEYRFSVVTFEHDLYSNPSNQEHKMAAYDILTGAGYQLVVANVSCDASNNGPFEDWYVDPTAVPKKLWSPVASSDVHCSSLFE